MDNLEFGSFPPSSFDATYTSSHATGVGRERLCGQIAAQSLAPREAEMEHRRRAVGRKVLSTGWLGRPRSVGRGRKAGTKKKMKIRYIGWNSGLACSFLSFFPTWAVDYHRGDTVVAWAWNARNFYSPFPSRPMIRRP